MITSTNYKINIKQWQELVTYWQKFFLLFACAFLRSTEESFELGSWLKMFIWLHFINSSNNILNAYCMKSFWHFDVSRNFDSCQIMLSIFFNQVHPTIDAFKSWLQNILMFIFIYECLINYLNKFSFLPIFRATLLHFFCQMNASDEKVFSTSHSYWTEHFILF